MTNRPFYVICGVVGVVAFFVKFIYSFLTASYAADLLWFGSLGAVVGYHRPFQRYRFLVTLVFPSLALIAAILSTVKLSNLRNGIGIGWVYSVPLIMVGVLVGGWIGSNLRRRKIHRSEP